VGGPFGAEVPLWRVAAGQSPDPATFRLDQPYFRSAAGGFGFVIPVEVCRVRPLRLDLPGRLRSGQLARPGDPFPVWRPLREVAPAPLVAGLSIRCCKPVALLLRQYPLLGAVGPSD